MASTHLRHARLALYPLTVVFCVASVACGTAACFDYILMDQALFAIDQGTQVTSKSLVRAVLCNCVAGGLAIIISGIASAMDLRRPLQRPSRALRWLLRLSSVLTMLLYLASAILLTIITATRDIKVTGDLRGWNTRPIDIYWEHRKTRREYRKNTRAVAAVIFAWLAWVSLAASCIALCVGGEECERVSEPKGVQSGRSDGARGPAIGAPDGATAPYNTEQVRQAAVPAHGGEAAPLNAKKVAQKSGPTAQDTTRAAVKPAFQQPKPAYTAPGLIDGTMDRTPYAAPAAGIAPRPR
ncbi:hypothetical protein LTR53_001862 [Teratosphaeriaceae sp. CCFEE 6253]|nr:hypothetical protein LTR53_001862 [Teratosphaeriaceae sp. CCFEE 6253]